MTVNDQASRIVVAGTGAQTQFGFGFIGVAPTYISVLYTDPAGNQARLTQGPGPTQYQVVLNQPVPGAVWGLGGTVTYVPGGVPIPPGSTLTIMRTLPLIQPVSLTNEGSLETLGSGAEAAVDRAVMGMQQDADRLSRAIVANPSNTVLPSPLPPANLVKGQGLCFDSTGNNVIACTLQQQAGTVLRIGFEFITETGVWVPPAGLQWAIVRCRGGGGAGGGAAGNATDYGGGGGGGSGGYAERLLTAAQIGGPQQVSIGAGGTGVGSQDGGPTSFGFLVVANGGLVGEFFGSNIPNFGSPGQGGSTLGEIGDVTRFGENGFVASTLRIGIETLVFGGAGGVGEGSGVLSLTGGGTNPGMAAPANSGSGGSGASTAADVTGVIQSGGDGGSGWCSITTYSF